MVALIVVLAIVVVLVVVAIAMYNNLVRLKNRVENAWSQIDVQLQRRLDLVPNLVETVKGYAAHESTTLQNVTDARAACMKATTPDARAKSANQLEGTLKTLFANLEAYPDLKANQNYLDLQAQLRETEDKVSYMRQSYNDTVMRYNNAIQTFPGNVFAGAFHFQPCVLFDVDTAAQTTPKVQF